MRPCDCRYCSDCLDTEAEAHAVYDRRQARAALAAWDRAVAAYRLYLDPGTPYAGEEHFAYRHLSNRLTELEFAEPALVAEGF